MGRCVQVFAIAAAIIACGVVGPTPAAGRAAAAKGSQVSFRTHGIKQVALLETQVLTAINDLRRQHGLAPLEENAGLESAARHHSLSMAQHGFFEHASFDRSPFWRRIEGEYPRATGGFWNVGENIVWASPGLSAERALQMWLNSPPHRKNLLTRTWRDIGLGAVHVNAAPGVYGGLDVTILTADFGVQR